MEKTKRFQGKVILQLRNFGSIECNELNEEIHFELLNVERAEQLEVGDEVTFLIDSSKGCSEAVNIKLLKLSKKKTSIGRKRNVSKYALKDRSELAVTVHYMKEKLDFILKKKRQFDDEKLIEDKVEYFMNILFDLITGPSPNISDVEIEDINNYKRGNKPRNHEKYWLYGLDLESFAEEIIEFSSIEVDKGQKHDFSIVWGEWRSEEKQIFNSGYTKGHFNYSYVDKGEVEQTHVYDNPPPEATWNLKKVKQKGHVFYIASAKVNEIAQSSYVPSLPPNIGITETANRVLDPNLKKNEWQREVDQKRIMKIEQFIGENNNIIANTPMLFIKDENCASIEGNRLKIRFDLFLKKQLSGEHIGKYIDRKKRPETDDFGNVVYDDYRPLWLIDGQHRVKGIHRNEKEQELMIPIIIFPHDFGMQATAKVFAEINTLQKKLNPLHELFMQHRFSIDHTNSKRKFRNYINTTFDEADDKGWGNDWLHSRANHLSYEILAMLAQKGPLKDKVIFLPQNKNNQQILVSADQWVNYARDWFYSGAYSYRGENLEDYIVEPTIIDRRKDLRTLFYREIKAYFEAWIETCNHGDWTDKRPRWSLNSRNKGLIQKKTFFIILLELYNLIHLKTKNEKRMNKGRGILTREEFMKTLEPFKWVDWTDGELQSTYPASGEKGRRSLEAWMADAIIQAEQFPYDKVHNSKIHSKPGRGITSYLEKPSVEISSKNKWPTKKNPVELKSRRPYNARYEARWSVMDNERNIIQEGSSSVQRHMPPSDSRFVVKHQKVIDELNELIVKVEWQNAHTRRGFEEIILERPAEEDQ